VQRFLIKGYNKLFFRDFTKPAPLNSVRFPRPSDGLSRALDGFSRGAWGWFRAVRVAEAGGWRRLWLALRPGRLNANSHPYSKPGTMAGIFPWLSPQNEGLARWGRPSTCKMREWL